MICFDTCPVIWGIQQVARQGQEAMIDRMGRYLEHLDRLRKRIMVPAPVLYEYLSGFEVLEFPAQIATIQQHFVVPAFDVRSASVAAELMSNRPVIQELRKAGNIDRRALRIDAQIIAVAIVNGAERIVTHNVEEFQKLAGDQIEIIDVPNIDEQHVMNFPEEDSDE